MLDILAYMQIYSVLVLAQSISGRMNGTSTSGSQTGRRIETRNISGNTRTDLQDLSNSVSDLESEVVESRRSASISAPCKISWTPLRAFPRTLKWRGVPQRCFFRAHREAHGRRYCAAGGRGDPGWNHADSSGRQCRGRRGQIEDVAMPQIMGTCLKWCRSCHRNNFQEPQERVQTICERIVFL